MTSLNPTANETALELPTPAGIADVIAQIVRDPKVHSAVVDSLRSIGSAITESWRRNDGNKVLLAAVQSMMSQARR